MLRLARLPRVHPRPMRPAKTRPIHTPAQDHAASSMLRFQQSLPALPVPALSSTLAKYLETVRPLLSTAEFARTQQAVASFAASPIAPVLQQRLEDRAARVGDNWLTDWWNEVAYMGYRDPVVVFVSYFYVHIEDHMRRTAPSRAAALVKAMLAFRHLVESETLEPDKIRGTPLCMDSYKWLFHASRYPVIPVDTAHKFDPATHNHIVVLRKNRFFVVPLVHPSAGEELSAVELQAQFNRILTHTKNAPPALPVGALTSDNRDNWARARTALLAADTSTEASITSPSNAAALAAIESAMTILCLDDTAPATRDDLSRATWVGDGRNRWFDKHQLIVYENGRSGFLGEHSCMDGTPTLRMNEFICAAAAAPAVEDGQTKKGAYINTTTDTDTNVDAAADLLHPYELTFAISPEVKALVGEAEARFDELVARHELHVLHYSTYGKSYMTAHRLSPDAWAQLIKQLAFFRLHARPPVTYESAQTRRFRRGRTEVVRSTSTEAAAWVSAVVNGEDPTHIRMLFQRAVARHMQYSAWAAEGQGVDRHLFGLKKSLRDGKGDEGGKEDTPALFTDPAYARSSHWELSTSQLSSPWLDGWGYGEVVPDGYGLSYAIGPDYIRWTITSERGDAAELKRSLAEAATQVRDLMEAASRADRERGVEEGEEGGSGEGKGANVKTKAKL